MDSDPLGGHTTKATRKMRFAPKAPPRRQKPILPKVEKVEEVDIETEEAEKQELLRRINEAATRAKVKNEKKPQVRVAFGHGDASSMRSYSTYKGGSGLSSEGGCAAGPGLTRMKEYKEPWDYYSYYPVTHPLRRPYSGNPELLDEEEFGATAQSRSYDENAENSAAELGLMGENPERNMIFFQLPKLMPQTKQSSANEGHREKANNSSKGGAESSVKACGLDEMPAGFMGKMLVYKSGAVKLKLGDILYDVAPGQDCNFYQELAAINVEEKHLCVAGEIIKHANIIPDVDSILTNISDL